MEYKFIHTMQEALDIGGVCELPHETSSYPAIAIVSDGVIIAIVPASTISDFIYNTAL